MVPIYQEDFNLSQSRQFPLKLPQQYTQNGQKLRFPQICKVNITCVDDFWTLANRSGLVQKSSTQIYFANWRKSETLSVSRVLWWQFGWKLRIMWSMEVLIYWYKNLKIDDEQQNRTKEGCSKLKRSVDITSSGKNGLNMRTNASPKWDKTGCPEE